MCIMILLLFWTTLFWSLSLNLAVLSNDKVWKFFMEKSVNQGFFIAAILALHLCVTDTKFRLKNSAFKPEAPCFIFLSK